MVRATPDVAEVNAAFAAAAGTPPLAGVLDYTDEPLVSSDIVGQPASCTFDSGLTMVQPIDDETTWSRCWGGTTTSGATPTAWSTWWASWEVGHDRGPT